MGEELSVVQVSAADTKGGAALIAFNLHRNYVERGLSSHMLVGNKFSKDPNVVELPRANRETTTGWVTEQSLRARRYADRMLGRESFVHPESWRVLDLIGPPPKILHCHNLHADYFDLRALPMLCQRSHVFLTLHDMWLLTGHCAQSLGCGRWKGGCGNCPDLSIYPSIQRDATRYNWRRKRSIYRRSHLHVAAPARWLLDQLKESMLASGVVECRVIPNGIDLTVFRTEDRDKVRAELGLGRDVYLVLFVAASMRGSHFKDVDTLRAAIALISERAPDKEVVAVAVGEAGDSESIGRARLHFVGPQDQASLVRYYQAADVYLHAARADTFPSTVLEALACGLPVVASDVCGIREQVIEGETGRLVPPGDAGAMAAETLRYLENEGLRKATSEKAVCDARLRFSLKRQADEYIAWYRDVISAVAPAGDDSEQLR